MERKIAKVESISTRGKKGRSTGNQEESNDLQTKSVSKPEPDVNTNNMYNFSTLNVNKNQGSHEKKFNKENIDTLAAETSSGCSSRLRRRGKPTPTSTCPPRSPSPESHPSSSAKKVRVKKSSAVKIKNSKSNDEADEQSRDSNITNQSLDISSDDEDDKCNVKSSTSCTAVALEKIKLDIKIDPNIVDRYTDSGFTTEGAAPESPQTRKERIDIISRQCRLHPANKKYNQGPVENPPLITPGKMVGYTPAGQRHEVDLNFDRPTWFNSEYARMQWDYATKVNVSRMIHDTGTGMFLPDGLDPNLERRYFAEEEMATKQATEHFEQIAKASSSRTTNPPVVTEEEKEPLTLLEVENELIELNKYAVVRLQDFAEEVEKKLRKVHNATLTPLMIKKNPVILDTLEILASQCIHIDVVLAARALRDKIKGLFQVPENQEFDEFFAAEVEKFKEKTKDMSGFDIMVMTEEPLDEQDDSSSVLTVTFPSSRSEADQSSSEPQAEWIPIDDGDYWIDSNQTIYSLDDTTNDVSSLDFDDNEFREADVDSVFDSESSPPELSQSDDDDTDELMGTIISEE